MTTLKQLLRYSTMSSHEASKVLTYSSPEGEWVRASDVDRYIANAAAAPQHRATGLAHLDFWISVATYLNTEDNVDSTCYFSSPDSDKVSHIISSLYTYARNNTYNQVVVLYHFGLSEECYGFEDAMCFTGVAHDTAYIVELKSTSILKEQLLCQALCDPNPSLSDIVKVTKVVVSND